MVTREPGGIRIAEQIREVILNVDHTEMHPRTEALLFAAARSQHMHEKVVPALKEGKIVLCDRFIDSSLVYQGVARELGIDEILTINLFGIGGAPLPDLTALLMVRPEVGLNRIKKNNRDENRLDKETLDFHNLVFSGYDVVYYTNERMRRINAEQPLDKVISDTLSLVLDILE
jgi:dTMP kinase